MPTNPTPTPAEYAESAAKYGIPCGPYQSDALGNINNSNGNVVLIGCVKHRIDELLGPCNRLAKKAELLPDLLIERDRMKGQIEKMQAAIEKSLELVNKFDAWNDTRDEIATTLHEARAEGGAK